MKKSILTKIIAIIMALATMVMVGSVAASAKSSKKVANGTYNVTVNFWNADKNQASMSNPSLKKTARLRVSNGKMTMTIYTVPMTYGKQTAYLHEMKVSNGKGGWVQAKVAKKDSKGRPSAFSFPVYAKVNYLPIKVNPHVKQMGNTYLDARLKISWNTLKKA